MEWEITAVATQGQQTAVADTRDDGVVGAPDLSGHVISKVKQLWANIVDCNRNVDSGRVDGSWSKSFDDNDQDQHCAINTDGGSNAKNLLLSSSISDVLDKSALMNDTNRTNNCTSTKTNDTCLRINDTCMNINDRGVMINDISTKNNTNIRTNYTSAIRNDTSARVKNTSIRNTETTTKDSEQSYPAIAADVHTSLGESAKSLSQIQDGEHSPLSSRNLLVTSSEKDLTREDYPPFSQTFDTDASNQTESSTQGSIQRRCVSSSQGSIQRRCESLDTVRDPGRSIRRAGDDKRVQEANVACTDSNFSVAFITDNANQSVFTTTPNLPIFNDKWLNGHDDHVSSSDHGHIGTDLTSDMPATKISKMSDTVQGKHINPMFLSRKKQQRLNLVSYCHEDSCRPTNAATNTHKPSTTNSPNDSLEENIALFSKSQPSLITETHTQITTTTILHEAMEVDNDEAISSKVQNLVDVNPEAFILGPATSDVCHQRGANLADNPTSLSKSTTAMVTVSAYPSSDVSRDTLILPTTSNSKHRSSSTSTGSTGLGLTPTNTSAPAKHMVGLAANINDLLTAETNSECLLNNSSIYQTDRSTHQFQTSIDDIFNPSSPTCLPTRTTANHNLQTVNHTTPTINPTSATVNPTTPTFNPTTPNVNTTNPTVNPTTHIANLPLQNADSTHEALIPCTKGKACIKHAVKSTHPTGIFTQTISNSTSCMSISTQNGNTANSHHLSSDFTPNLSSKPTQQTPHHTPKSTQQTIKFSVPHSKPACTKASLKISSLSKMPTISSGSTSQTWLTSKYNCTATILPPSFSSSPDHHTLIKKNCLNPKGNALSIIPSGRSGTSRNDTSTITFKTEGNTTDIPISKTRKEDLHFQTSSGLMKLSRENNIGCVFGLISGSKTEMTVGNLASCQNDLTKDSSMETSASVLVVCHSPQAAATPELAATENDLNDKAVIIHDSPVSYQQEAEKVPATQNQMLCCPLSMEVSDPDEQSLSSDISTVGAEVTDAPSTSSMCVDESSLGAYQSAETISPVTPPTGTRETKASSSELMGRSLRNRNQRKFLPEKTRHKRQTLQDMTRPLKQWLYKHRANPYPSKHEKMELVGTSHMSLTQVSNWFANARRRLKNTVCGDGLTWAKRVTEYNHCAEGNAELFSIPSSDEEEWNSENEANERQEEEIHRESPSYQSNTSSPSLTHTPSPSLTHNSSPSLTHNSSPSLTHTPSPSLTHTSSFSEPGIGLHAPGQSSHGGTTPCSPALDDQHSNYHKYKHSILQRYLQDASQQAILPVDDLLASRARHRHLSSSTGSHDFEYLSTSSVSSPSHETPHDSFDEFSEEFETIAIRRRVTENPSIHLNDDMYWKEIGAALALTSLARSHITK